jgi:hypothetical protein
MTPEETLGTVLAKLDQFNIDGLAKTRSAACWPLLSHWNR